MLALDGSRLSTARASFDRNRLIVTNSPIGGADLPTTIGLGTGNVGAIAVSAAHDADDGFIYNSATGRLCFDPDGTGGIVAVQYATLSPRLNLAASDFAVF